MTQINRMKFTDKGQIIAMHKTLVACAQKLNGSIDSCLALDIIENFWTYDLDGLQTSIQSELAFSLLNEDTRRSIFYAIQEIICVIADQQMEPGMFDEAQIHVHRYFEWTAEFMKNMTGDEEVKPWLDNVYRGFGGRDHYEPFF